MQLFIVASRFSTMLWLMVLGGAALAIGYLGRITIVITYDFACEVITSKTQTAYGYLVPAYCPEPVEIRQRRRMLHRCQPLKGSLKPIPARRTGDAQGEKNLRGRFQSANNE